MLGIRRAALAAVVVPVTLASQSSFRAAPTPGIPQVGPAHGTVIVVGGGAMGPEIYSRFIEAAGGPDALIVDVPAAGGDSVYTQDAPGARAWKLNGARHIYVYHTLDRKLADSDSFVAVLAKAGGVWFEGGRQFHLVDDYAGTKTEQGFRDVLARGGVVGGSSAGASILGDFLVRGAPSNNNFIMDYPGYEKGFAYLRGVGIDQHVVARERLPDLADSIMPKYPGMLAISEDEGTAWVVRGDTATIIGRNKAFVYGGKDANDPDTPFLTLHPGDRYNMATRRVMHRAVDDSPVTVAFVRSLFWKYATASAGGATVLVAENGEVFIDQSFGIPDQARYMPTTTVPQFPLGGISEVFAAICSQLREQPAAAGSHRPESTAASGVKHHGVRDDKTSFQNCIQCRLSTPIGMHKTTASADGDVHSDVDELYRMALGLENPRTYLRDTAANAHGSPRSIDYTKGWQADRRYGVTRLSAFADPGGKRGAFVRIPEKHAAIIILTNDATADADAIADRITEKLLSQRRH